MSPMIGQLLLGLGVFAVTALGAPQAAADSWALPTEVAVYSRDRTFRLRIIPRELGGQLAYFESLVEKRAAPGQAAGGQRRCFGILEKRGARSSTFDLVWSRPLLNDVAPVAAIVSDDGKFVATFDNWHSTGYGPHALVIYGPGGELIKKLGLFQFLQESEIEKLSRSVSSVGWYLGALFERRDAKAILRVDVFRNEFRENESPPIKYLQLVQVHVDAATGTLLRSKAELTDDRGTSCAMPRPEAHGRRG